MRTRPSALALTLVAGLALVVPSQWAQSPPAAQASTPGQEWFVAQAGTPTFGNGTSCSVPDVVGDDDTAIRTVLAAATMDDTITICNGVYDITQTLIVDDSIAIQGQSTAGSILDGGNAVQIMRLSDDDPTPGDSLEVRVLVTDLTFRNGNTGPNGTDNCNTRSQCGGAIYVEYQSDLTVKRSYFEENRSSFIGGAIANSGLEGFWAGGDLRVEGSTFYRNTAGFDGGAIGVGANFSPGLTVINSTFVENSAISRHGGAISESFGGGVVTASTFIDNQGPDGDAVRGNFTVTGSLFAGPATSDMCSTDPPNVNNTSVSTGVGCGSAVIVTADSLNLRGLGEWGGPTPTVWIGPGSTAFNANTGTCQARDQRGASRSASPCDAGAYERRGPTDEGTAGSLDYASPMLVDETALPLSSPTPSPPVTGRTIGYLSLSTSACSVNDASGEITAVSAGTCEVQWYLAPTLSADGAAVDDSFTIVRAAQAPLVINPVPQPVVYGDTIFLTTSGGSGPGAVTFSQGASTGCIVYGWMPTTPYVIDASGTCTVTATKAATTTYESVTSAPVSIALSKATQIALVLQAPSFLSIGSAATLVATGGSTGQAVTFGASPLSVCTLEGDRLRMLGQGTCRVTATMPGDGNYLPVSAPEVLVESASPEPPDPTKAPTPPRQVVAKAAAKGAMVTWQAPAREGEFPISTYQVVSQPSGGSCLALAPALSCEVTGLSAGRKYSFMVRALNGSGWSAFSESSNAITVPRAPEQAIVIVGSREGRTIVVTGSASGLSAGIVLHPWVRLEGQGDYVEGGARIAMDSSGDFTWSRRAGRPAEVYVASADGSLISNVVRIPGT